MPCLDTNVLIELSGTRGKRRQNEARAFLSANLRAGEAVTTTRVNEAELLVGVERSDDREESMRRAGTVLSRTTLLELDAVASAHFGKAKAFLLDRGRPVDDMDILIAAICLANGQSLITRNPRHFVDIPGLTVETY